MQITRGDTKTYRFQRHYLGGEVITQPADKVFFTVKKLPGCELAFQKSYGNGITFNTDDNYYYISIKPEDTNSLCFGNYGFDIEITQGEVVSTICVGKINIGIEYTTKGGR